jgi:type II secretory pathway pseudopilin PulG
MSTNEEAGFSLVELLVSALLFGAIAWMASSYFARQQKSAAARQGRDEAVKMNQYLGGILRRDLLFSLSPADVTVNSLHEIVIKRPKRQPNGTQPDPTQNYQVTYRGICTKFPASLTAQMGSVNFSAVDSKLQARSTCLKNATLKCAPGSFPQLQIEFPKGADIPNYSAALFPDEAKLPGGINRAPIAVLPCFQRSGNQITVGLDIFTLKQDTSADSRLDLSAERLFLVIGNASDMVIMQK